MVWLPAPYGTDVNGTPLNDPIPDTILNATTGALESTPATGTPSLLDKFIVTKPDITQGFTAQLTAPPKATANGALVYSVLLQNNSGYALNGAQVRVALPASVALAAPVDNVTVQGSDIVVTLGRVAAGGQQVVQVKTRVTAGTPTGSQITAAATVMSGTALPVASNSVTTTVVSVPGLPVL